MRVSLQKKNKLRVYLKKSYTPYNDCKLRPAHLYNPVNPKILRAKTNSEYNMLKPTPTLINAWLW